MSRNLGQLKFVLPSRRDLNDVFLIFFKSHATLFQRRLFNAVFFHGFLRPRPPASPVREILLFQHDVVSRFDGGVFFSLPDFASLISPAFFFSVPHITRSPPAQLGGIQDRAPREFAFFPPFFTSILQPRLSYFRIRSFCCLISTEVRMFLATFLAPPHPEAQFRVFGLTVIAYCPLRTPSS